MLDRFRRLIMLDTEFHFGGHASLEEAGRSGERPRPVCLCAKELRSGKSWKLRHGELGSAPPFPTGPDTLIICYYASAEMGFFKACGWTLPTYVLDLFVEFRAHTNGRPTPNGAGLLGALTYFAIDGIGLEEKRDTQTLIIRGGPWTEQEWSEIIAYCWSDVLALEKLLAVLLPHIDLPRAILRGRFMKAAALIEWYGIPIDAATLALLRQYWGAIQDDLIRAVDRDYGVFDGRSFRLERFEHFLARNGIPWPRLESGRLDLSDGTFRQMARIYPVIAPLRELRAALSELRLADLAVGTDARNRTLMSAFRARTSRCQPSNSKYIFGPSVWLRFLIAPPPGYGVAYIDWCQQEHGIAARLSGDLAMQAAYLSGDPYLEFAKQAGAVPPWATKQSHPNERELFKQCTLAVAYGMEAQGLANRIGQPIIVGRNLLRAHHETCRRFWPWSDAVVDTAVLHGSIATVLGWPIHTVEGYNPRSLRNFPMQANGAEMLRLAACFAVERGIEVCALVNDAVLICAPLPGLSEFVEQMRACMAEASRIVLDGFELRTDVHIVQHPDRYEDPRGKVMWQRVMDLIAQRVAQQGVAC